MLGRQKFMQHELLAVEHTSYQVKIAIQKLQRYKSPGNDKIPVEIIQVGGNTLCSEIHKIINSIWNEKELPQQ
jgi:hypothetical protein